MIADEMKRAAAVEAIKYVEPGTIIGVGTGSTVNYFIDLLAEMPEGIKAAVASSKATAARLQGYHIEVVELNQSGGLELYVDGTDEVDAYLNLIKGGGGALTREKIIAAASKKFVCIADESKMVDILGKFFPLPIEVIPMARSLVARKLMAMGGKPELRKDFITDNGNIILDVHRLELMEPLKMEREINNLAGVVCTGIFSQQAAHVLILGGEDGARRVKPKVAGLASSKCVIF